MSLVGSGISFYKIRYEALEKPIPNSREAEEGISFQKFSFHTGYKEVIYMSHWVVMGTNILVICKEIFK